MTITTTIISLKDHKIYKQMGKVYTNKYSKKIEGITFNVSISRDTFTLSAFDGHQEICNPISDMLGFSDKETLLKIQHAEKEMLKEIKEMIKNTPPLNSLMKE